MPSFEDEENRYIVCETKKCALDSKVQLVLKAGNKMVMSLCVKDQMVDNMQMGNVSTGNVNTSNSSTYNKTGDTQLGRLDERVFVCFCGKRS